FALVGLLILLLPALVRAEDDAKGAQQALADFAKAAMDGDAAKLKQLVYTHSENEKKLLDAAIDYTSASKKLKEAVNEKLGADAAKELAQAMQLTPVDEFLQQADMILK